MSNSQSPPKAPDAPGSGPAVSRAVVLVGLMGVGKTSVGRKLASQLAVPFVDADDEIEKAAAMTCSEIFERYGEAAFRDGEQRVIARLMDGTPKVVATGGGAFTNPATRDLVLKDGIAVWLNADIDILVKRTARRNTRPLLKNGNAREVLSRLAEERSPDYALAPIHVRSGEGPVDAVVDDILRQLEQHQDHASFAPAGTSRD